MTSRQFVGCGTISGMRKLNQTGMVDTWLIAFILTLLVLFGVTGFGFWAYAGKQDYKTNVDAKIAVAVQDAQKKLSDQKTIEFAEKEKLPLRSYTGPAAYGSLGLSFPKTWSAYITESDRGNAPVDGYLNPNFVPDILNNSMALRFQVINTEYSQTVKPFESQVKSGKITISPYAAPKAPTIVGLRVNGQVASGKQGSMIVLPLRDKTLKVWTESTQFIPDFDTIILPNLTFIP